ncbi:acyl-homoserine-lactone synthase [Vitreimonas sp.]|uniref:acyl-homoserine-lactone synthase n=1 Tax=Vitreimonas sp. TaxID=3069702 RepID=UPI002EDA2357
MIQIITRENRALFHHALTEMHRQRRRLFIDEMGWGLAEIAGLEIDQFDSEDAIYLIEMNARGEVLQSARLIPTTRPHMLSEKFASLCSTAPPSSPAIWEASRFCPAPETPKGAPRRRLLARMIAAILETGLLFGMERVTFVASAALAPLARTAGWRVHALGPVVRAKRDRLAAFAAEISADGLAMVRARNQFDAPLTRHADTGLKRAA